MAQTWMERTRLTTLPKSLGPYAWMGGSSTMKAPYYEVKLAIKTLKELRVLLEFIAGSEEGEIEAETMALIEE